MGPLQNGTKKVKIKKGYAEISSGKAVIPGYYYDEEKKKYFKIEGAASGKNSCMYTRDNIQQKEHTKSIEINRMRERELVAETVFQNYPKNQPKKSQFAVENLAGVVFNGLSSSAQRQRKLKKTPSVLKQPVIGYSALFLGRRAIDGAQLQKSSPRELAWYVRGFRLSQTVCLPDEMSVRSFQALSTNNVLVLGLVGGQMIAIPTDFGNGKYCELQPGHWVSLIDSHDSLNCHTVACNVRLLEMPHGVVQFGGVNLIGQDAKCRQVLKTWLQNSIKERRIESQGQKLAFAPLDSVADTHDAIYAPFGSTVVADGDLNRGEIGFTIASKTKIKAFPVLLRKQLCAIKLHPSGLAAAVICTNGRVKLISFSNSRACAKPLDLVLNRPFVVRHWLWLQSDERFAIAVSIDGIMAMLELTRSSDSAISGTIVRVYGSSGAARRPGISIAQEQSFCVDSSERLLFQVGNDCLVRVWSLWAAPNSESSPVVESIYSFRFCDSACATDTVKIGFVPKPAFAVSRSSYVSELFPNAKPPVSPFLRPVSRRLVKPQLVISYSNTIKFYSF